MRALPYPERRHTMDFTSGRKELILVRVTTDSPSYRLLACVSARDCDLGPYGF